MTRDDIIRIAQEAGAFFDGDCSVYDMPEHCFEKFAALVAANEREECAKLCDKEVGELAYGSDDWYIAKSLALIIRARGET
jgi:hypothetical protein